MLLKVAFENAYRAKIIKGFIRDENLRLRHILPANIFDSLYL